MRELLLLTLGLLLFLPAQPAWAEEEAPPPPPSPSPELTAERVVVLQLEALQRASDPEDAGGMPVVWVFASPENQAVTGPYENFNRMVREGAYAVLVGHAEHAVVDRQEAEGDERPTVQFLVRLVDAEGEPHLFAWAVSKRADDAAEHPGCWLTEAVAPVAPPPPSGPGPGGDPGKVA